MTRLTRTPAVVVTMLMVFVSPEEVSGAKPSGGSRGRTVELGRRIFEHNWARPESWSGPEELGKGGDGLGPMFNDVSCVACHHQGGAGGAGGNDHNVEVLSVDLSVTPLLNERLRLLEHGHDLHPGFSPVQSSLVLHHFGFGDTGEELKYQRFRSSLVQHASRAESIRDPGTDSEEVRVDPDAVQFRLELAQRSTPALWGLGEIESLRKGRGGQIRKAIADEQKQARRGVTGRIPRTFNGGEGVYGWRGQVADLRAFVSNACSTEMGLHVPGNMQPSNPVDPDYGDQSSPRYDLTQTQVTALTAFVESLPRPRQVVPDDPHSQRIAQEGERQFHRIGCADCHVKDVGHVTGIFSDFLLHDMGTRMGDRSTANPDRPMPSGRMGGDYYSGRNIITSDPVPTDLDEEWRTPPLWGAADSAPYLHDGRAETFEEAIQMHGGEAANSAEGYRRLNDEQRSQLLSFLDTLRAPLVEQDE